MLRASEDKRLKEESPLQTELRDLRQEVAILRDENKDL